MSISLKDVGTALDALSDRISTQVRTLSIGVLAIAWLFLSKGKDVPQLSISHHEVQLAGIALFTIVAIVLDLAQYQVGYIYSIKLLRKAENANASSLSYDKNHPLYRARIAFFLIKQFSVCISAIWLIFLLAWAIFGTNNSPC